MNPIKLLLIEDNPGDARLISEFLSEKGNAPTFQLEWRQDLISGLGCLDKGPLDLLLLDLGLPDSRGFETFDAVRQIAPEIAIVVLTGTTDEELGLKMVSGGAQDYLVKGQLDRNLLVRSIRYAIERKQSEKKLKNALQEKDVLIKEVHHRVKNNLQMISSLLALQIKRVNSDSAAAVLRESQNRIRSIALVHERLYRSADLSNIHLADYIQLLANNLFYSYGADPEKISLQVNVSEVLLDIDAALPCGLIINELVSNALRYAFPDGQKGIIRVALQAEPEESITLVVSDDGVGFPPNFDPLTADTLGWQLVKALVGQLSGKSELSTDNGMQFTVTFPRNRVSK